MTLFQFHLKLRTELGYIFHSITFHVSSKSYKPTNIDATGHFTGNARTPLGTSTVTQQNVTKIHLGGFCRRTSKDGVSRFPHDTVDYVATTGTLDEIC